MLFVELTKSQLKQIHNARAAREHITLKLTKKQVQSAAEFENLESAHKVSGSYAPLVLNAGQLKILSAAKNARKGTALTISKSTVQRGGFFFAIAPLLAALFPAVAQNAKNIAETAVAGYSNVSNILTGKPLDTTGWIDKKDPAPAAEPEKAVSQREQAGSSLMLQGSGKKRGRKPKKGSSLMLQGSGSIDSLVQAAVAADANARKMAKASGGSLKLWGEGALDSFGPGADKRMYKMSSVRGSGLKPLSAAEKKSLKNRANITSV